MVKDVRRFTDFTVSLGSSNPVPEGQSAMQFAGFPAEVHCIQLSS